MKKFETVRKLSNLGRILSKIVFVCTIIGMCLAALAMVLLIAGVDYDGIMNLIASMFKNDISMAQNIGTLMISLFVAVEISFAGKLIIAKCSEKYFGKVVADGTPFNEENSKRLLKLGVLLIVVSLVTSIIIKNATMLFMLMSGISGSYNFGISLPSDVILGGLFIFMSYVCKYGAEILDEKQAEENAESVENNEIKE